MRVTKPLASAICATDFSALPREAVERTLQAIGDGVTVAIAGCDQVPVTLMAKLGEASQQRLEPRLSHVGGGLRQRHGRSRARLRADVKSADALRFPDGLVAFALIEARGGNGRYVIGFDYERVQITFI